MSRYVVFQCTKCGKANTHEVRKSTKEKGYYLSCKYCEKKSNFLRANIFKITDNPQEATLLLNKINLGKIKALPLEEAEKIFLLGVNFVSREEKKVTRDKPAKTYSSQQIMLLAAKELEEFSFEDLEDQVVERGVDPNVFEKYFEKFCKRGFFIETSRNKFRYIE